MLFTCWVLEIIDARTSPGVIPFKGVEHDSSPTYHYTLEIDGAIGSDGIMTGELKLTSAKPLTFRAGQNIMIEVDDVPLKETKRDGL